MQPHIALSLALPLLVTGIGVTAADETAGAGPLPSGNTGIAARHPGDRGIASDDAVIFVDDFESYTDAGGLAAKWEAVYHNVSIATKPADVFAGTKSLLFTSPKQDAELSNGVAHILRNEVDLVFFRYYAKYDTSFDVVGSSHNGGGISAHYFTNGNATPGVPADGRNKFLMEFECWRGAAIDPNPGTLNVYIYHPEQRSQWGDHFLLDGKVMPNTSLPFDFGKDFVAHPAIVPELGRWYCYEIMLKANTPGKRDGRIALWLDGIVVGDFGNLRLRDTPTLTIDRVGLSLHTHANPVRETKKWYDQVVVAKSYIGPLVRQ